MDAGYAQRTSAIILAGGDGSRLAPLTRKIAGYNVPKQFCSLFGEETLLAQTRRRVSLSISHERTVTVLSRHHRRFYSPLLSKTSAANLAIQPSNRGTAVGILYGLLRLIELGHRGTVAIFPSDHFVSDDPAFMRHVESALAAAAASPLHPIVLLGVPATRAETQYGWIEPGEPLPAKSPGLAPSFRIRHFWEKPSPQIAVDLWAKGFLWNTFVMAADIETLLGLFARTTPHIHDAFAQVRAGSDDVLDDDMIGRIYANLPSVGFSEAILTASTSDFAVLPVRDVEWSDLGEPHRVMAAMSRLGLRPRWLGADNSDSA
jgi:mannose-1-phosphate guanylyltransferase